MIGDRAGDDTSRDSDQRKNRQDCHTERSVNQSRHRPKVVAIEISPNLLRTLGEEGQILGDGPAGDPTPGPQARGLGRPRNTRLSELILGQALLNGYTHVITQGVYLTNSGLQFAAASRVAGLTPDSVSHP